MSVLLRDITYYKEQNAKLQRELDEMTIALAHAWDQLVPFLQDMPDKTLTADQLESNLEAILVASDTDVASIYLFQSDDYYVTPDTIDLSDASRIGIKNIREEAILELALASDQIYRCAFSPVYSESEIIGVLWIGSQDVNHVFSAADMRLLKRMADRIGNQFTANKLAMLREEEAIRQREMEIANEIQNSLQPTSIPENDRIHLASHWQPARQVGGDAWGWHQQGSVFNWFVLDVAGKGLPAALAAVSVHTAIQLALRLSLFPQAVLEIINKQFYDAYTLTDLMATVAIMSVDVTTGELEIANAGHPPVLIRHQGNWMELAATAPPIGVLYDLDVETQSVQLDTNDLVICYSDGFSEIDLGGKLWGQEGILRSIPRGAKDVARLTQHIVTTSQFAGTVADDQTLVTVRYTKG